MTQAELTFEYFLQRIEDCSNCENPRDRANAFGILEKEFTEFVNSRESETLTLWIAKDKDGTSAFFKGEEKIILDQYGHWGPAKHNLMNLLPSERITHILKLYPEERKKIEILIVE